MGLEQGTVMPSVPGSNGLNVGSTSYGAGINNWAFKNSHVPDPNVNPSRFMSAGRCVVYAQTSSGRTAGKTPELGSFVPIGLIQAYSWTEQRQIDMLFELGSELPYLVPGRTTGQIAITRMLMHGRDLANVLYGATDQLSKNTWIRSLKDIATPLNLMFAAFANSTTQDTAANGVFSRVFSHAWINSRSEQIGAGQTVIGENCSLIYEDILSVELFK